MIKNRDNENANPQSAVQSMLCGMIYEAVNDCFFCGHGMKGDGNGTIVKAQWVDSGNDGKKIVQIAIEVHGNVKFVYNDGLTEMDK